MAPSGRFYRPSPGNPMGPPRPGWNRSPGIPPRSAVRPPSPYGIPARSPIMRSPGAMPPMRQPARMPSPYTRQPVPLFPPSSPSNNPPAATRLSSPTNAPVDTANGDGEPLVHMQGQKPDGPAHMVFDLMYCETFFPRACAAPTAEEDKAFMEALLHRHQEISLQPAHQTFLTAIVTQFTSIVDQLVVNPTAFEAAHVLEVRAVGAFKSQTVLCDQCEAELVLLMRTLPTQQAVTSLAEYCGNQLRNDYVSKGNVAFGAPDHMVLRIETNVSTYGFDVLVYDVSEYMVNAQTPTPLAPSARLMINVSTTPQNLGMLDPTLHLDAAHQHEALAKVRRSLWMEENASHTSIRVLVRLLKDLSFRFEGMSHLTPWMIDLLAHYVVMTNMEGRPVPLNVAFKRVFQLLAAGFFLPGSAGIPDPSQQPNRQTGLLPRIHYALTMEQQDELCCTAQTVLRTLSHDGLKSVLGWENVQITHQGVKSSITDEVIIWNGIMVAPSERVVATAVVPAKVEVGDG